MGQEPGEIRQQIEQTRTEMGETVDALAHKADVKSRVKESISDRTDRFRRQMSGAGSSIAEATPDGRDVKQGAEQAVGIAQENPIGLAVGGLAAGFLVGMLLPTSRVEDERLGSMSDDLKDHARETGQEALERGKDVTEQVVEQAADTAKEATSEHADEMTGSGDGESGGEESQQEQEDQGAAVRRAGQGVQQGRGA